MTIRHRSGCGGRPSAGLRRWGFVLLPVALLAAASPRMAEAQVQASDNVRQITVDEAVEIALRRNPQLLQAYSQIEMAEHNQLSAIGQLLPSVNMSFGYSNSSTGRLDALSQGIVATSYSTQINAGYTLFNGWSRFTDLKGARLGIVEQNARYREAEFQVIQAVKQAYSANVAALELVAVEERRVQRQADQLEFVRQQLELGRATRSDSLRSQVDLNNAQLALLNAENNARTRTFELTEVVGSETLVGPTAEAELAMAAIPFTRDELFAMADVTAPALQAASAAVEAAEAAVSSARSSYLPTISIGAGYGWANQEFPPSNRSWSIGLSGSYPLFNGFQRETQVFRARASADQARQSERAARLNISSLLDARYATAQSALAGVDLAERNVELSEESLRVVQERYQLGLATILELQDAQITLTQAEVDLVSGRFQYEAALAGIEALLGRRLDQPQP
ncbi:TolC family protein [Candidatus Palauibacter polyketidifaciens]|uniref:TolC family protein n=1 Tax=Candidatus Palauibacter polyketidifaciens TaxID=3056740 RepID=UPI00139C9FD2|nr:TolC family protein [Candidatus Palauibacter polyketidifaciens]MDE2720338.1 TolC family protein [Candidatus Palauibacter polyketidifaciens]MYE35556.1 TolC family protein [Gemmatimonadales bacterium]